MGGAILDSLMFGVEAVISLEVESVEGIQGLFFHVCGDEL